MLLVTPREIQEQGRKSEPARYIADGEGACAAILSVSSEAVRKGGPVPQHCDGGGAGDFSIRSCKKVSGGEISSELSRKNRVMLLHPLFESALSFSMANIH